MNAIPQARRLRVILNETDKLGHRSLAEQIVHEAHAFGISGATVVRGILSYGASAHFHASRVLDLANDLPVLIEIIDENAKINQFMPILDKLFERAACGGIITSEAIEAWRPVHRGGTA